MIHGRRSPACTRKAGAGGFGVRGLVAVLFLLPLALVGGCGGGSDDDGGGGGGGTKSAAVTGRILDQYNSNQPLAGATVTVGSLGAGTTGADGVFLVPVVPNGGNQNVTVAGPSGVGLYDYANVNGTVYKIRTQGVPIPSLATNQTYTVGDVVVASETGPPPPPTF